MAGHWLHSKAEHACFNSASTKAANAGLGAGLLALRITWPEIDWRQGPLLQRRCAAALGGFAPGSSAARRLVDRARSFNASQRSRKSPISWSMSPRHSPRHRASTAPWSTRSCARASDCRRAKPSAPIGVLAQCKSAPRQRRLPLPPRRHVWSNQPARRRSRKCRAGMSQAAEQGGSSLRRHDRCCTQ